MFKTKTHLPELIKEVQAGEELCITNRGKKVAFIIPVARYSSPKFDDLFKRLKDLRKRAPLGDAEYIRELKNFGRK